MKPEGALYAFPRLDPEVYDIHDDEQLVLDLLLQEKILVVQGTGFNWPAPDHLRIVTLPWARDLANAIERLGNFLAELPAVAAGQSTSPPLYPVRVAHSHSHVLQGPAPLGPLAAKIVVGLLIAIGVAVIAGAALLWPSQQKRRHPAAVPERGRAERSPPRSGHVLSSHAARLRQPVGGRGADRSTRPAPPGNGASACRRWSPIDSGPNTGANTLLEFSGGPGPAQPRRR